METRGGFHTSWDTEEHYCVRAFRQDGYAYKTMHIYSAGESVYYKNGKGQFGRRGGTSLDLTLRCVNLG